MSKTYEITEEIKPKTISYTISESTRIITMLKEILGPVEKDDKIPYGFGLMLKDKIKGKYSYIINNYNRLKTILHGNVSKDFFGFREFTVVGRSERNKEIMSRGYGRGAPLWERDACNKLIFGLEKLPYGGIALIFGSPAPLSVSRKNYNHICDDNLEVIHIAKFTTDEPGIIMIGDLVNDEKAIKKCQDFKELNSISSFFRVLKGPVTAPVLKRVVTQLAKQYPLVKVIIMTSGVWKHSTTNKLLKPELAKYDLNFERASHEITKEFDNVHVLAMSREGNSYGFTIVHVHKGKQSIIPKPRLKYIK